jgi:hypothetical protein
MPTMDDPFDAIVAGLDIEEPTDVVDITSLTDLELVDMCANVRQELLESGQMLGDSPVSAIHATHQGRELHSLRVALLVEMTKRGLR